MRLLKNLISDSAPVIDRPSEAATRVVRHFLDAASDSSTVLLPPVCKYFADDFVKGGNADKLALATAIAAYLPTDTRAAVADALATRTAVVKVAHFDTTPADLTLLPPDVESDPPA